MSDELKVAIEAAKRGAQHALRYFDENLSVTLKEDKTPVTKADRETEKIIRTYIQSQFPRTQIVGEETGGDIEKKEFWTIDPIDGTRSYTRGIPFWCVLISFCRNKEAVIGVCHYPLLNATLYAEKGCGTFLNHKKVHVSKIDILDEAFLGYGNPRYISNKQSLLRLIDVCGSSRSWEATYSNFLLAQGKMDVFVDGYGQLWDTAPFKVITEEAEGKLTNLDGSE